MSLGGKIEAVLLTGGASRRMGSDKSKLLIEGETLGSRIARLITGLGIDVTVLGREPIKGHGFLADLGEFEGPLAALARFSPTKPLLFICSCDLPGFDPRLLEHLAATIGDSQAAIPEVGGRIQPLCALYRNDAMTVAREVAESGERRIMAWIDRLEMQLVTLPNEDWASNVNAPDELRRFC